MQFIQYEILYNICHLKSFFVCVGSVEEITLCEKQLSSQAVAANNFDIAALK